MILKLLESRIYSQGTVKKLLSFRQRYDSVIMQRYLIWKTAD